MPFATRTAMEGEKIIFKKLTPVAESSVFVIVIGHGIGGKDIPIMARLVFKARRWSKR